MITRVRTYFFVFSIVFLMSPFLFIQNARAGGGLSPHPVDHTGWKVDVGGYVELDGMYDTTRSYTEVPNSGPVSQSLLNATAAQGGSVNGDTPRYQESARNTRFRVYAEAPEQNGWQVMGFLETDFNGFDPSTLNTAPTSQSENNFYASPTLRMRVAQVEMTKNGWTISAGQMWDLFGWQPYYELSNNTNDSMINIVHRVPNIQLSRDLNFSDDLKLEAAVAVAKPDQRDSAIPNLEAGVNLTWKGRVAPYFSSSHTHAKNAPTSIEVSALMNQISRPNSDGYDPDRTGVSGGGLAVSALIPILTGDEKDPGNSLTILGEASIGSGLANQFPSFTSGLGAQIGSAVLPNIDAGFVGWDNTGAMQLLQTQETTVQLQYFAPVGPDHPIVVNVEYGIVRSNNAQFLFSSPTVQTAATAATYDYTELYVANVYYGLTKDVLLSAEYDRMDTHYFDGNVPVNNRLAIAAVYMF